MSQFIDFLTSLLKNKATFCDFFGPKTSIGGKKRTVCRVTGTYFFALHH